MNHVPAAPCPHGVFRCSVLKVFSEPAGKAGRLANPGGRPLRKATHIYSQRNHILSAHEAKNRNRSKTRQKYGSIIENSEDREHKHLWQNIQEKGWRRSSFQALKLIMVMTSFNQTFFQDCWRDILILFWKFVEFLIQTIRTTLKVCRIILYLHWEL